MSASFQTIGLCSIALGLTACTSLPSGTVDAAPTDFAIVVHCAAGQSTFPDLDRACATDGDCFIALHQTDCCGSRVALGLRRVPEQLPAGLWL